MISYGPNNTVSVESAVVLRRVTSADAPTLRPATAEQLSARASLLPRPRLSADVQRRRELLHTFQQTVVEPTVSGTKSLNKYQRSVPLSQFGVDLVSAATSAPLSADKGPSTTGNGAAASPSSPSSPSGRRTLQQHFAEAQQAAESYSTMENLLPVLLQRNPYLQHLQEQAKHQLHRAAVGVTVASTSSQKKGTVELPPHLVQPPSSSAAARRMWLHHAQRHVEDVLFEEWSNYVSICEENSPTPLSDEQLAELFASFMKVSSGNEQAKREAAKLEQQQQQQSQQSAAHARGSSATTTGHGGGAALDDLPAPSGGGEESCVAAPTTTFLAKPKMMLDANEKRELIQQLTLQAHPTTTTQHRAKGRAFVSSASRQQQQQSPRRGAAAQEAAQRVFTQNVEDRLTMMQKTVERTIQRQQSANLRLSRRRNLDIYRLEQQAMHLRGLTQSSLGTHEVEPLHPCDTYEYSPPQQPPPPPPQGQGCTGSNAAPPPARGGSASVRQLEMPDIATASRRSSAQRRIASATRH